MRRKPFSIVPNALSNDTVEALRELLSQAERGEVIGIAYAAMIKGRHYVVDTAGELHENPTFARGLVKALDDELGRRVWGHLN